MTTISTNTNIIKIKYHSIPSFIVPPPPPHPTQNKKKNKNHNKKKKKTNKHTQKTKKKRKSPTPPPPPHTKKKHPPPQKKKKKKKKKKKIQSHNYTVYSPYNLINFTPTCQSKKHSRFQPITIKQYHSGYHVKPVAALHLSEPKTRITWGKDSTLRYSLYCIY